MWSDSSLQAVRSAESMERFDGFTDDASCTGSTTAARRRMNADIEAVLRRYRYDGSRLIDILWDVQHLCGHIPDEHLPQIATGLNRSPLWRRPPFITSSTASRPDGTGFT